MKQRPDSADPLGDGLRPLDEVLPRWLRDPDVRHGFEDAQGLPADTEASASLRAELLAQGWLDSDEVARRLGGPAGDSSIAERLQRDGKLLGVWVAAEVRYRYPPCQFEHDAVRPQIPALLKLLPPGNGSGWSRAFWLYLPHASLGGATPAALLAADPERVVAAAQDEFGEDSESRW